MSWRTGLCSASDASVTSNELHRDTQEKIRVMLPDHVAACVIIKLPLQKDAEPLLTLDASKNHSHLSHHHNTSTVYRSVTWL